MDLKDKISIKPGPSNHAKKDLQLLRKILHLRKSCIYSHPGFQSIQSPQTHGFLLPTKHPQRQVGDTFRYLKTEARGAEVQRVSKG